MCMMNLVAVYNVNPKEGHAVLIPWMPDFRCQDFILALVLALARYFLGFGHTVAKTCIPLPHD